MKKAGLIISLLFCAFSAFSQNDVKVRFGVEGGFNMSKWAGDYSDIYGTSFKPGFNGGGLAEIQINPLWSVQSEFVISMEGTKTDGGSITLCKGKKNEQTYQIPSEVDAWYFKVPIYVLYNFKVGPGRLSPGVGLYLAWAFAGSSKSASTFADDSYFRQVNETIKNDYKDNSQYYTDEDKHLMDLWDKCIPRRFDYGIGIKGIYELENKSLNGLFGSLGVTEGLTGCYNLNLMFSVGYKFKYNKWLRTTYNTGILEYNP
jgi:hypothetical protein